MTLQTRTIFRPQINVKEKRAWPIYRPSYTAAGCKKKKKKKMGARHCSHCQKKIYVKTGNLTDS